MDTHGFTWTNIFLNTSNARILSRDIAAALRGRTLPFETMPLSFAVLHQKHGKATEQFQ